MHTYNIITKLGKGNHYGAVYTFIYQVDGKSERHRCELYCRGSQGRTGSFCYLSPNKYPFIESEEDKDNFINEIKQYQKGSSYRKTHPIAMTDSEELEKVKKEYEDKIAEIELEIAKLKKKEVEQKYIDLKNSLDVKSLTKFVDKLRKILNDERYSLRYNRPIGQYVIYDKQLDKPIKEIQRRFNGEIVICDIETYNLSKIL